MLPCKTSYLEHIIHVMEDDSEQLTLTKSKTTRFSLKTLMMNQI